MYYELFFHFPFLFLFKNRVYLGSSHTRQFSLFIQFSKILLLYYNNDICNLHDANSITMRFTVKKDGTVGLLVRSSSIFIQSQFSCYGSPSPVITLHRHESWDTTRVLTTYGKQAMQDGLPHAFTRDRDTQIRTHSSLTSGTHIISRPTSLRVRESRSGIKRVVSAEALGRENV